MTPFDTVIIEKIFTPITGWVNTRFGVDQWRLAIECLNGTVAFYLAGVALTIASKGMTDAIFADLLAAFAWLMVMDWIRRAHAAPQFPEPPAAWRVLMIRPQPKLYRPVGGIGETPWV